MTARHNTSAADISKDDTSRYSYYVDDGFYAQLTEGLNDWDAEGIYADEATRVEIERLLMREARLLDVGKLEEWLGLFSSACLYWIPAAPGGGDPRREVSIAFDDRRRLEDRVFRIRTGYAWSQVPASRTARMLGNLEVWRDGGENALRARCSFLITEFRAGRIRQLAGWYGYRLCMEDDTWKIKVKMVNLVDCDQGHENLTLIL